MNKVILAVAILIAYPVFGQEVMHAPTVAQCRADATLWQSQASDYFTAFKKSDTTNTVVAKMTAKQLQARSYEMGDCLHADPDNAATYTPAQDAYIELFLGRMYQFIKRHNLMDQFYQEDEAGAR